MLWKWNERLKRQFIHLCWQSKGLVRQTEKFSNQNWDKKYQQTFKYFVFHAVMSENYDCLEQWLPTGVPQHTRVPWRTARGVDKYYFIVVCVFLLRVPQIVIKRQVRVPPNYFCFLRVPWTQKCCSQQSCL